MLSSASRSLSHDSSIRRLKYQLRASFSVPVISSVSLDLAPSWAFYGHFWYFGDFHGYSWLNAVNRGHSRSFTVIHGHTYSGEHDQRTIISMKWLLRGSFRYFIRFLSLFIFQPIRNLHFINPRDHFLSLFSSGADLCPFYVSDISICYPFYIFILKVWVLRDLGSITWLLIW